MFLVNGILLYDYEVVVVTIVIGTGECKVRVRWFDEGGKQVAEMITEGNTIHIQMHNVNKHWTHEVDVQGGNGDGVRLVYSFRFTLSRSMHEGLYSEIVKKFPPSVCEKMTRAVKGRKEMYCLRGNLLCKAKDGALCVGTAGAGMIGLAVLHREAEADAGNDRVEPHVEAAKTDADVGAAENRRSGEGPRCCLRTRCRVAEQREG